VIEDPEFMLSFNVLTMAKNLNFFGQADQYMKEYARIMLKLHNQTVAKRLEEVLSKEISILPPPEKQTVMDNVNLHVKKNKYPLHENVLAQGHFQFMPAAVKWEEVKLHRDM
jgi:hypothetical protein